MMDDGNRHRVGLWLRAERAMGLSWAPGPRMPAIDPVKRYESPAPMTSGTSAQNGGRTPKAPARAPAARPEIAPPSPGQSLKVLPLAQAAPLEGAVLPTEQKRRLLEEMDLNEVRGCVKCRLSRTRTHTVFGEGDPDAKIFFIGEGPGENEDETGRPFVGKAGNLLTKMITGMGLTREQVFITNIVKCRPPGNRVPMPDEVAACTPYLIRQLEIIRPKVIVTLGLPAAKYMLGNPKMSMGSVRGRWQDWRGIKLMPTYHPSYVLRTYTPEVRRMVWDDLKAVMKEVGLKTS